MLHSLEACSVKLSAFSPKPHLSDEQLTYISDEIDGVLLELMKAEDISESLRRLLVERLKRVKQAVDNVWFDGTGKVKEEVESVLTTVVTQPEAQPRRAGPTVASVIRVVLDVARIVQTFSTVDLPQLEFLQQYAALPGIHTETNEDNSDVIDAEVKEVKELDDSEVK